jgi:hypothetical protein
MTNMALTPEMKGAGGSFPIPAPFQGLNTREAYTALQPTEARVLENWLPDEGAVKVRPGHTEHDDISGATSVPSLMKYKGTSASKLIAAASDGKLYDATGVPAELATGYTVNRWSHDNFNGWLFGVNGADTPWRYDGSAVAATGFSGSGLTIANLETVKQVRNRLWFTEENSADVWYGGIGSVTGTLTKFQLSQIASGGACWAIGSWSRDAGDGSDDFTVFVMNTGQVIVYQGDPATNFALVGKYSAPAPAVKDGTVKVGGELVILTVSGPIPTSAAVAGNAFSLDALQIWGKIAPSWKTDYARYGSNAGWNAYFYDGLVYFNIATGLTTTKQYVLNTRVSAWTVYTKLPAAMFADHNGSLYFGSYSDEWVYRHATGTDNGAQIITLARQGASYPMGASNAKRFTAFQPLIDADGPTQMQFALDIDFRESALGSTVYDLTTAGTGADWTTGDWGEDWGAAGSSRRKWHSAKGFGRAVAPVVRTLSTADSVSWFASHLQAVPGGVLGST